MKLESALPILLQPVDSPRRDLEAKIVQAAFNANAGFTTVIGTKRYIVECQRASRNAFWVGRLQSNDGRTPGDVALCEKFEGNATSLFFHHDEGAFHARKTYKNSMERIHPLHLHLSGFLRKFMLWGELQKQICLELCPDGERKMIVTGTPRFDLYAPKYKTLDVNLVEDIQGRWGDFILFCTQFKDFNFGPTEIKPFSERHSTLFQHGFNDKVETLRAIMATWRFCGDKFSGFLNLILESALSFPRHQIVIRVHPSEDIAIYNRLAACVPNICVAKDGDIRSFLRAAKVVVHSESTTGIEALMANKCTVNWSASSALKDYAIMGAGEAGITVHTIEEGLQEIECGLRQADEGQDYTSSATSNLSDFLGNIRKPSIPLICGTLQAEVGGIHGSFLELPRTRTARRLISRVRHWVRPVKRIGRNVPFSEFSLELLVERLQEISDHDARVISVDDDHIVIRPTN